MRRSFALNRNSVAASRQFVSEAIPDLSDELRAVAVLMVSELATNAIVHAATGFEVTVDLSPESLRIGVTDVGGGEPELQAPPTTDAHGRGLLIVRELSDEWGMFDNPDHPGKTVWCTLRLDSDDRPERRERSAGEGARGRTPRPLPPRRQTRNPDDSKALDERRTPRSPRSKDSRCSASRPQDRPRDLAVRLN